MYPHERSLVKQLKDYPFAIVGVNSDGDPEKLKKRIAEENITWRSFQNDQGDEGIIADRWGIAGWPTIFILDEDGVIRWKGHGGDIDGEITKLLKKMGHDVELKHETEESDARGDDDHAPS